MSRDERREYEADVYYEVWRSGGNPDRIDFDRVDDMRYDGLYAEEAADRELRRMYPPQVEEQGQDDE